MINLVRLLARQLSFVHIDNIVESVLVIAVSVTAVMGPSMLLLYSLQSLPSTPVMLISLYNDNISPLLLLITTKSTLVISKMLLPVVIALMSRLLCESIMHILNGEHNVTTRI